MNIWLRTARYRAIRTAVEFPALSVTFISFCSFSSNLTIRLTRGEGGGGDDGRDGGDDDDGGGDVGYATLCKSMRNAICTEF